MQAYGAYTVFACMHVSSCCYNRVLLGPCCSRSSELLEMSGKRKNWLMRAVEILRVATKFGIGMSMQ